MGWNLEIRKLKFETACPLQYALIKGGRRGNYYSLFMINLYFFVRYRTILAFGIFFNMGCLPDQSAQDI